MHYCDEGTELFRKYDRYLVLRSFTAAEMIHRVLRAHLMYCEECCTEEVR